MSPLRLPTSKSATASCILTINGGSSTIRFAIYEILDGLRVLVRGKVDRIGRSGTTLISSGAGASSQEEHAIDAADHSAAIAFLLNWLAARPEFPAVVVVSHRLVHGMSRIAPTLVTPDLLIELRRIMPFDPEHLPFEIDLIDGLQRRNPKLPQIACFDTAFHRSMPQVAKLLPIPRRYQSTGVERYGFHGLSYAYLMEELLRLGDPAATHGRVVLAHLGSGASVAAVRDGKSIDTSMGFTPNCGLMMSTRSGDLDPGLYFYLAQTQQMDIVEFNHMVNHAAGLLGVSETSADVRDLLAREGGDLRAAEALAMFCYQTKKWLGAYAAALGGLDTLVFAGGIGENSPAIRERICKGLGFLGVDLQPARNAESAAVISTDASRVRVRVIRTDEELMLARYALPFCEEQSNPS